jgi:hypothetical protein
MKTSYGPRMLQIAFSLVLSGAPIAFAQMDYDLASRIQLTSVGWGRLGASASHYVRTDDFTNQFVAPHSISATNGDPDAGLAYSFPPSQKRGEAELDRPSLSDRVRLEDLVGTASPYGWRTGGGGLLSYTTRNQHWHLVFRYAPGFSAPGEDFDRLDSFSVIWQFGRFQARLV